MRKNPNYDLGPVWRVTYYHLNPVSLNRSGKIFVSM